MSIYRHEIWQSNHFTLTALGEGEVVIQSGYHTDTERAESELVIINGIKYRVTAWLKHRYGRWMVRDIFMRRDDGGDTTPNAKSKMYRQCLEWIEEEADDSDWLRAGDIDRMERQLKTLEKEAEQLLREAAEKRQEIEKARSDLATARSEQ